MIYELLRLVFKLILNLFFRDVKVRGFHNVPEEGPVLFVVAPHANQFIDPLLLVMTCGRKAKKSMDRFWIGLFGRCFNSIPVERPQDLVKKGTGLIYADKENPLIIRGTETRFTEFKAKYSLLLPKGAGEAVINTIVSDTELLLSKPFQGDAAQALLEQVDEEGKRVGTSFNYTPHVDQSKMFSEVVNRFAKNNAVGIFPEGGSHDRPEMLPLKAGVSVMALETLSKFPGTRLKIVPCGLHYFNADKFRSRAVVEYGEIIEVPIELVDQYKRGGHEKRESISLLLDTIHVRLKALTVQAPDYDSLMIVQASRRLYQTEGIDADAALVISRRFAKAYQELGEHEKIKEIKKEVLQYNRMLKFYGVRDHQVKNTHLSPRKAVFLLIIRCLEVLCLAVLVSPIIVLFSPLFLLTKKVSRGKAAEALAGSKVKISGKDVVSTWKLLTALVVTPVLWLFYTLVAFFWFYIKFGYSSGFRAGLLTFLGLPLLGLASIRLSDLAVDVLKSIRPLIVALGNLMSSSEPLREMRAELQRKIRHLVDELGPELFPGEFEEIRILNHSQNPSGRGVIDKLGRSKTFNLANVKNDFFDKELENVKMDI